MPEALKLTFRQRYSWLAHVLKAVSQDHHREMGPILRPVIAPDAVVLDVGAHAGQFARLFARLAPRGHIYAFEPTPYARSVLRRSLGWRGVRNVTICPVALSDTEGELTMATPLKKTSALGFGLAHVARAPPDRPSRMDSARAMTLDRFVEENALTRLDFVKCDIEGWEMRFLIGALGALARFKPALFIELNDQHLARAGDTAAGAFALLQGLGYRAQVMRQDGGLSPVSAYEKPGDFLFTAR